MPAPLARSPVARMMVTTSVATHSTRWHNLVERLLGEERREASREGEASTFPTFSLRILVERYSTWLEALRATYRPLESGRKHQQVGLKCIEWVHFRPNTMNVLSGCDTGIGSAGVGNLLRPQLATGSSVPVTLTCGFSGVMQQA